ncbi:MULTISPECIES: ATPase RavA stimulator ViaA [Photorhabdus]|uniref:Regulatory protein ViaA n=2 Tax=Photorhabdus TaxID=29487 RepID=A0ABX0B112_9GAMM|nr:MULTISPECIES: ATPase RavA stimulator ViaA [Photorhabdus]MCC8375813.1 ATPase RavA stimulator ViaA [Photorhabdus bodei]MCT8353255.1 ATPase RavA stimulator ViaA [Photorhabdus kayaii]MDB6369945.1 ATPase RavA stimulator ViaA [Photorhabdus bodei]MDB6374271.1 ATPase RavA stimulator ViaA [Photorhabdus bodei]NDL11876.1 ATPase RavA stimulator ViaA [Photorhabdus kayaii]
MISLTTLDLLLSINEGEMIEEIILTLLASPQLAIFFEKHPRLKRALLKDIPGWKHDLQQRIKEALIPATLAEEFQLYQQVLSANTNHFYLKLPDILETLNRIESPFSEEAQKLATNTIADSNTLQTLFIQRWRISLILQTTTFQKQLLEQEKEQLLAELQQRLTLSGNLDPVFSENDRATGRLWDMSKSQLNHSQNDKQLLIRYSEFLHQQPELKKLAQLLGRSQSAKSKPQENHSFEPVTTIERTPDTVPEQVNGIGQSDDILRLLPIELAILGIEDLEYEFYRKLVEKKLLTYRLQGDNWREKTTLRPVTYYSQEERPRGPFIICVDTSGSMGKFNEKCAKAFCLALLRIALADNRNCHIMLFTTGIVHYELSSPDGLEQAIRFLSQTFKGGTDLAFCLTSTIEKMKEKCWKNADAVVISDFIAQRLPNSLIHQIKNLQLHQQHRFHAVSMSQYGKPDIMRIFDHIWHFDTGLKSRLLRKWRH